MAAFDGVRDLGERAFGGQQGIRNFATRGAAASSARAGAAAETTASKAKPRIAPDCSSAPSRQIGVAAGAFSWAALVSNVLVPRNHPRHAPHDQDSAKADQRRAAQHRRTPRPARNARQRPGTRRGRRSPANAVRTGSTACSQGDFNPGQSRGRKRTVIAASARKCANRSTSRSVLSIGYIHCSSQRGIRWLELRQVPGHRHAERREQIGEAKSIA